MTVIRGKLAQGREFSVADLTASKMTVEFGAGGDLVVTLTPDVTAAVALAVRNRIISSSPVDEGLRNQVASLSVVPAGETATAKQTRMNALTVVLAQLALEVP